MGISIVFSMEAVISFDYEYGLGCDGEKGSQWTLEDEDLLASVNIHSSHVLVLARDRGRRMTEIVNGVDVGYSDTGHEKSVLVLLHTFREYQQHQHLCYWRLHLHYWH
jgi:hypothetical protein